MVVIWILGQSSVEKCPCQVVHSILFVFDSPCNNLCHKMIMEEMIQVAFDWKGFKKELLVVFLPWAMAHQYAPGRSRNTIINIIFSMHPQGLHDVGRAHDSHMTPIFDFQLYVWSKLCVVNTLQEHMDPLLPKQKSTNSKRQ